MTLQHGGNALIGFCEVMAICVKENAHDDSMMQVLLKNHVELFRVYGDD